MPNPDSGGFSRPVFSVVVPAFDEAEGIAEFHRRLSAVMDALGEVWEVVYVNDGSHDLTLRVLEDLRAHDRRMALVNLSRNFGKEIAT
ncbi:MAG TPA: glycosyltransferase, partial [Acidisoma sp.]